LEVGGKPGSRQGGMGLKGIKNGLEPTQPVGLRLPEPPLRKGLESSQRSKASGSWTTTDGKRIPPYGPQIRRR